MSGEARLVPLTAELAAAFELPAGVAAHDVRTGLDQLLAQEPGWSWAAMGGDRPVLVGGMLWLSRMHCFAALAAAAGTRPMQWRPFFLPLFRVLEQAHNAGARRIETQVLASFEQGHRLVMALGFTFDGVQRGYGEGEVPWLIYARLRDAPALPRRCERYRRLLHVELLRQYAPGLMNRATAADLRVVEPPPALRVIDGGRA